MKTKEEILFESGIHLVDMVDDFNTQLLHAMEEYASLLTSEKDKRIEALEAENGMLRQNVEYYKTLLKPI